MELAHVILASKRHVVPRWVHVDAVRQLSGPLGEALRKLPRRVGLVEVPDPNRVVVRGGHERAHARGEGHGVNAAFMLGEEDFVGLDVDPLHHGRVREGIRGEDRGAACLRRRLGSRFHH